MTVFNQKPRFTKTWGRQADLEEGGKWASPGFYHGVATNPRSSDWLWYPICLWPPGVDSSSGYSNGHWQWVVNTSQEAFLRMPDTGAWSMLCVEPVTTLVLGRLPQWLGSGPKARTFLFQHVGPVCWHTGASGSPLSFEFEGWNLKPCNRSVDSWWGKEVLKEIRIERNERDYEETTIELFSRNYLSHVSLLWKKIQLFVQQLRKKINWIELRIRFHSQVPDCGPLSPLWSLCFSHTGFHALSASGPLHLPFLLPRALSLDIHMAHSLLLWVFVQMPPFQWGFLYLKRHTHTPSLPTVAAPSLFPVFFS